jgi:hypothetical protein
VSARTALRRGAPGARPPRGGWRARVRRAVPRALALGGLGALGLAAAGAPPADAQAGAARNGGRIAEYWQRAYAEELEAAPAPPPALPPRFGDHGGPTNVVQLGATYTHQAADFTGKPTRGFVVDDRPPLTATPRGFAFPPAFERRNDRLEAYLAAGTRGFGDPRVNTYASAITQHDLDGTPAGSPFQGLLDAFAHGQRTELLNAYIELSGFGTGAVARSSLRLGRQFVLDYAPDLLGSPTIDGASLAYRDPGLALSLFSGRRVSFYGERDSDVVAGAIASVQLLPQTSAGGNYFYISSAHRYAVNLTHQIGQVQAGAFVTFRNRQPIDGGLQAGYAPAAGPWILRGKLVRRLTDEDFTFDVFGERESGSRLSLFRIRPATQLTLDADYQVDPRFSLGGGVAARAVDRGEAPFDNAFVEVAARAVWTPWPGWDTLVQYRFRHVERGSLSEVIRADRFDDIGRAGETLYHEVNGEIYARLAQRFGVRLGGYFGLFNTRSRLAEVNGVIRAGGYAQGRIQVHRAAEVMVEYGVDRGDRKFNPDIAVVHSVRAGFHVYY